MARRKKPDNETGEQALERRRLESVANHASRSEKTSWERKRKNMELLIDKLEPLEAQILELMDQKMPILDEIMILRNEMVESCVHPLDLLVTVNQTDADGNDVSFIRCKFCERKINPQQ